MIKNILIVCPTELEAKFLIKDKSPYIENPLLYSLDEIHLHADILISGIGQIQTAYNLLKTLSEKDYSLVLHIGICGAFSKKLSLGQIVNINSECFADLGVETKGGMTSIFEMGLIEKNKFPFSNSKLINTKASLSFFDKYVNVKGISVNSISLDKEKNRKKEIQFAAEVESMEGATVFYICLRENINFAELRAVSNFVGESDKSLWKTEESIANLNKATIEFLSEI